MKHNSRWLISTPNFPDKNKTYLSKKTSTKNKTPANTNTTQKANSKWNRLPFSHCIALNASYKVRNSKQFQKNNSLQHTSTKFSPTDIDLKYNFTSHRIIMNINHFMGVIHKYPRAGKKMGPGLRGGPRGIFFTFCLFFAIFSLKESEKNNF